MEGDLSAALADFTRRIEFGRRLRNRRTQLKLTQVEVASAAGWTSPVLLAAEAGKSISPDVVAWVAVANKLQLNPPEVIDWVWRARGSLEVPYCERPEPRKVIIEIALESHGAPDEVADAMRYEQPATRTEVSSR